MEKYFYLSLVFIFTILAVDVYCLYVSNRMIREAQKEGNAGS